MWLQLGFYDPQILLPQAFDRKLLSKQQQLYTPLGARALPGYLFSNVLISVVRLIKNSRHVEKQQLTYFNVNNMNLVTVLVILVRISSC